MKNTFFKSFPLEIGYIIHVTTTLVHFMIIQNSCCRLVYLTLDHLEIIFVGISKLAEPNRDLPSLSQKRSQNQSVTCILEGLKIPTHPFYRCLKVAEPVRLRYSKVRKYHFLSR